MASRLRPTDEFGTVAATKQSAQSIGPSWSARGGRNARLAMRDAIRRGDREAAMSISMAAEKAGLPAQASIGSYEARTAANLLGRQAAGRVMSEQQAALDAGRTMPGQTTPPAQGGTPSVLLPDGRTYVPGKGIALPGGAFQQISMPQYEPGGQAATPPTSGQAAATPPAAANTQPPPVAPGATPPPENPVTGSAVPSVSDVSTRLSQRGRLAPGIALQGLAGRQAFDANLQKSIEAGGREISEGRFNNMLKEANRLGVSREQLLNRLQDMGGVSLPRSAVANPSDMRPADDAFLADVVDLTRADGENMTRKAAVEEMNRRQVAAGRFAAPVESVLDRLLQRDREASAARVRANVERRQNPAPGTAADLSRAAAALVGTAPSVAEPPAIQSILQPALRPRLPAPPRSLDQMLRERQESVATRGERPSAFEGSQGAQALNSISQTLGSARARARAQLQSLRMRGRENVRGSSFEGTPLYRFLTRDLPGN